MAETAPQPPLCLCLLIADGIHRDPGNGKFTILGTFSSIFAPSFPAQHPLMVVYCAVTDGRGNSPFRLQLVDSEEERKPVAEAKGIIEFDDPRAVHELALVLHGLVFPEPGEYRLQLFGCDELLMERRIVVISTTQEKEE